MNPLASLADYLAHQQACYEHVVVMYGAGSRAGNCWAIEMPLRSAYLNMCLERAEHQFEDAHSSSYRCMALPGPSAFYEMQRQDSSGTWKHWRYVEVIARGAFSLKPHQHGAFLMMPWLRVERIMP